MWFVIGLKFLNLSLVCFIRLFLFSDREIIDLIGILWRGFLWESRVRIFEMLEFCLVFCCFISVWDNLVCKNYLELVVSGRKRNEIFYLKSFFIKV